MNRAEALARAHRLAGLGQFVMLPNPVRGMQNLDYDEENVAECILSCGLDDIKKEMKDIYRDDRLVLEFKAIQYGDDELYLKFSVPNSDDEDLIVLSFKHGWGPV